jgi:hypothetical protein
MHAAKTLQLFIMQAFKPEILIHNQPFLNPIE